MYQEFQDIVYLQVFTFDILLVCSVINTSMSTYRVARQDVPFKKEYCGGTAGSVTDDTVLRHYMCLAIVRKGGRITPDDFVKIRLDELNSNRLWTNEKIVKEKLEIGMNPWDMGKGQPPTGCKVGPFP